MAITFTSLNRAVLVLILAGAPLVAAAGETRCPAHRAGDRLSSVSLFDGPPSEHADLAPDSSRRDKLGRRSTWDVAYIFQQGRKLFVVCRYDRHSQDILLSPPQSTRKCEYRVRPHDNNLLICR